MAEETTHTSPSALVDDTSTINNPSTKGKRGNNGTRGSNYTAKEDLMACKAFIRASENPITGADQSGNQFAQSIGTVLFHLLLSITNPFIPFLFGRSRIRHSCC